MNNNALQPVPWSFLVRPDTSAPARAAASLSPAAFLGFRLAVEDDFIWQSGHEHDLSSGSGLISWLMAHVLQTLTERMGPDCLIFPAAGEWPGTDELKREFQRQDLSQACRSDSLGASQDAVLGARASDRFNLGLPSHFLAVVPVDYEVQPLLGAAQAEWKKIARSCWTWLADRYPMDATKPVLWESQTKRALRFVWQLWPWQERDRAADLLRKIGAADSLLNPRPDAAWLWQANLVLLNHRLLSRQQTFDFPAWEGRAGVNQDQVNRRSEAILEPVRQDANRKNQPETLTHPDLPPLFHSQERLGALNVIKRLWPRVVLGAKNDPLTATLAPRGLAGAQTSLTGRNHPASRPMALLVWAASTARMNFAAQGAPRQIADHHGRLLRSVQDQGVAWLPVTEVLACAQALHQDFRGASSAGIDMGAAIPVGAVSFPRLIQSALEAVGKARAGAAEPDDQNQRLVVRLVDSSRVLAEWNVAFGTPALTRLSKVSHLRANAPAMDECAAWCGSVKQILRRLHKYSLQQIITASLAEIVLADLESVFEKTGAALEVRSGCREYLNSSSVSHPQRLSEFWNWLVLSHFFAAASARLESTDFAE